MTTEEVKNQQKDQDKQVEKAGQDKELSEQELDQASGGLIGLLTPPSSPSISPQITLDHKDHL